jgi:hypothetical protein
MAVLAASTEATPVSVIRRVAIDATLRHLKRPAHRLLMAARTGDSGVCPTEWEARFLVVIEAPEHPGVGRMTILAAPPELSLVYVVPCMASSTRGVGLLEGLVPMT